MNPAKPRHNPAGLRRRWMQLTALVLGISAGPTPGAVTLTISNPASINIRDYTNALPYPSSIGVNNAPGRTVKVTATLNGFAHTFPNDVDILLSQPGGASVLLMASNGQFAAVNDVNLTFDDSAASVLPMPIVSGTYRPNPGLAGVFAHQRLRLLTQTICSLLPMAIRTALGISLSSTPLQATLARLPAAGY
jgi:hypothetical protein